MSKVNICATDAEDGYVLLQGVLHSITSLRMIVNQVKNVVGSDWHQMVKTGSQEFQYEISSPF
jgi:hypothetical protein